jgi:hypothetical protein
VWCMTEPKVVMVQYTMERPWSNGVNKQKETIFIFI